MYKLKIGTKVAQTPQMTFSSALNEIKRISNQTIIPIALVNSDPPPDYQILHETLNKPAK
jgi:hypothetical protein